MQFLQWHLSCFLLPLSGSPGTALSQNWNGNAGTYSWPFQRCDRQPSQKWAGRAGSVLGVPTSRQWHLGESNTLGKATSMAFTCCNFPYLFYYCLGPISPMPRPLGWPHGKRAGCAGRRKGKAGSAYILLLVVTLLESCSSAELPLHLFSWWMDKGTRCTWSNLILAGVLCGTWDTACHSGRRVSGCTPGIAVVSYPAVYMWLKSRFAPCGKKMAFIC